MAEEPHPLTARDRWARPHRRLVFPEQSPFSSGQTSLSSQSSPPPQAPAVGAPTVQIDTVSIGYRPTVQIDTVSIGYRPTVQVDTVSIGYRPTVQIDTVSIGYRPTVQIDTDQLN